MSAPHFAEGLTDWRNSLIQLTWQSQIAFVYDLLVGPLFMRAVVWGQPLPEDAAEKTADVVVAAFAPKPKPASASRRRSAK